MAEEGGSDKKPKSTKGGCRCVLGGCSNTIYDGFSIHEMPKTGTTRSGWIRFIQCTLVGFKANERKRVHVCSGHFDREQYDQSQLRQYRLRLRKLPPKLLPSAIPHIKKALQPFPPDWFIRPETEVLTPSAPTSTVTTTITTTSARIGSPPGFPCSTTTTPSRSTTVMTATTCMPMITPIPIHTTPHSSRKRNARSVMTATPEPMSIDNVPIPLIGEHDDDTGSEKRKRRRSGYLRQQEVRRIEEEFKKKEEEKRAEEMARRERENNKAIQSAPMMVSRKSQVKVKKKTKTCGLQVRPFGYNKGLQTDITYGTARPTGSIELQHVATQTDKEPTQEVVEEEADDEGDDGIEIVDDERLDPSYKPNEDEEDIADEGYDEDMQPYAGDLQEEKKYIVFESELVKLFKQCKSCGMDCDVQKVHPQSFGSQLKIVAECRECTDKYEWYTQPKVGDFHAGNILLSASILFAGASPAKVLKVFRHFNLQGISNNTFIEHQTQYLQPAIIRVWDRQQSYMYGKIKEEGGQLNAGGDMRADTPGHSAKYGSYTFMDMDTSKVIDVQLVQSTEVKNSNAMELEGLRRGMDKLNAADIEVQTLITDRHMSVAKWIRETYPDIDHRYDIWHIAKGIKKKIKALAKTSDCQLAGDWKRSIINHVYWCATSTEDGDGDVIVAKYKSLMNHIRNIHTGHDDEHYPSCEHPANYPDREWMTAGTKVYEKLSEIILRTRLLKDISKMSHKDQTSKVEAFHSVLLHWCPKMLAYSYPGIKCRLYLAAIHWNENSNRKQATRKDGTPIIKITFPRPKEGCYTVNKVLTACTYNYVDTLMSEVLTLVSGRKKIRAELVELQPKPALCAAYEHPDKAEAIRKHKEHQRFAQK